MQVDIKILGSILKLISAFKDSFDVKRQPLLIILGLPLITLPNSPATVVTLYMLPWFNEMMRPDLQRQLKPGSRIVAHDFSIEDWPPSKVEKLPEIEKRQDGYTHRHKIFLWKIRDLSSHIEI